jgi:hypothetical protein
MRAVGLAGLRMGLRLCCGPGRQAPPGLRPSSRQAAEETFAALHEVLVVGRQQAANGALDFLNGQKGVGKNHSVGKSKDGESVARQFLVTISIVFALLVMNGSINFNNKLQAVTAKVHHEATDQVLPAEVQSHYAVAAKIGPEGLLGLSRMPPHRACGSRLNEILRVAQVHALGFAGVVHIGITRAWVRKAESSGQITITIAIFLSRPPSPTWPSAILPTSRGGDICYVETGIDRASQPTFWILQALSI